MDKDDLQFHQIGSCPGIENEDFVQQNEEKIFFRWVKDRCVTDREVHIILADVDNQIGLYSDDKYVKYESKFVSMMPGNYEGQIIIGDNIHPLNDVIIDQNSTVVEIEIKSGNGDGQLIVAAKNGSSSLTQMNATTSKEVLVKYELNRKSALAKKMAACEREEMTLVFAKTYCTIQLSTASFEYFREDVIERINNCTHYKILRHDPVKDLNGCITGEIIGVGTNTSDKLFVVNLYQTQSSVMINGSKLPYLTQKLSDRGNAIEEVNKQFKGSIPKAMSLLEQNVADICSLLLLLLFPINEHSIINT